MIQLFKKGTSRIYQGITCDSELVDGFGFEPLLAENGGEYYLDPKDIPVEKVKKPEVEETLEDAVDDAIEEAEEAKEALKKVKTKLSAKVKKES